MMSPELGFALFLMLLWGPTALWLVYHAVRGRRSRRSESFRVASETVPNSLLAPGRPEVLVAQGFWVCGECRSLNRRETGRCYSCKTMMGSTGQPTPAQQPARGMVAVMAEPEPAKAAMVPVMAQSVPVMAQSVPVIAASFGQPPGSAAPTIPAPAARRSDAAVMAALADAATPVMAALAENPTPVLTAAPRGTPVSPPVCPFLGFRDDPSTRCDYPDPRNQCHATSSASRRRFLPGQAGANRSREIDASHQRSRCLTSAHEACARYPAVKDLVANG
jgi:hypothetical protein